MVKIILPFCLLLIVCQAIAQQGRQGPEQDCSGALFTCGNNFTQIGGYLGAGQDPYELPGTSCLFYGKNNSVWYTFTIDSPGLLSFLIEPLDTDTSGGDDYDFDLYNTTGYTCADITSGTAPEVRCSFALNPGAPTGIAPGGDDTTWASLEGAPILEPLQVVKGQTFKLLVDNLQSAVAGFTLDFSKSTCTFINSSPQPFFNLSIDSVFSNPFVVNLNYFIYCDSLHASGSNFTFIGPEGVNIVNVSPNGPCTGTINSIIVTLDSLLPVGTTFHLAYIANSLNSPCGNVITTPDTVQIYRDTSGILGIEEVKEANAITLYPNPTSGKVQVNYSLSKNAALLEIYNTLGVLVKTQETEAGIKSTEIDLGGLHAATYMLLIKQGSAYSKELIVKD